MIAARTAYIGNAPNAGARPGQARIEKDLTPLTVRHRSAIPFLEPTRNAAVCVAALALLAGCGRSGADWREGRPEPQKETLAAGYLRPPQVTGAARAGDDGAVLSGQGEAGVRLRLVSPDGGAYGATDDDGGHWRMTLPASAQVRLFGLSEEISGRVVQSEGYVAVLPPPGRPAVLLRAGGGAAPLFEQHGLEIAAIDFDAAGGAVISGAAKPGAVLRAMIDGASAGETHAGPRGHYAVALTSALKPGAHQLQIQSAGAAVQAAIAVSPPPRSSGDLPYRGERVDGGWRIDWLTPGGGPQTTLVLDPPGAAP